PLTASIQSTGGRPSSSRPKCFGRSPMPCPRPGRGMLMRNSDRKRGLRPEAPYIFFDSTLPPLASQSFAFLAMVKLWPLQSFLPLQSWLALLQLPLPFHSFVPSHWTPFAAFCLGGEVHRGP